MPVARRQFTASLCSALAACTARQRPPPSVVPAAADGGDFWASPKAGANTFAAHPSSVDFVAAREFGLRFLRLTPSKWMGVGPDYLLGDADRFERIPRRDLEQLVATLDRAEAADMGVVLTMLSLPGHRWRQHNGGADDGRLWSSESFAEQAVEFWRQLAESVAEHPAIVGLNPLNEPHPQDLDDLTRFNRRLWEGLREVAPVVPLVLDAGAYASPEALAQLKPLDDPNVLYSLHVYEPWGYTNWKQNGGKLRYPGPMPRVADGPVDRQWLRRHLQPVVEWQRRNEVEASRILVGEFGCDRRAPGAARYLADAVELFEANDWHWAFYSFRDDDWPGMDYEIGDAPLPESYWRALERGQYPVPPRGPNPLVEPLQSAARRRQAGAGAGVD